VILLLVAVQNQTAAAATTRSMKRPAAVEPDGGGRGCRGGLGEGLMYLTLHLGQILFLCPNSCLVGVAE